MFNDAERVLMTELLVDARDALRVEINRTDSLEYKKTLRERETLLESTLEKLRQPAPAQPVQPVLSFEHTL